MCVFVLVPRFNPDVILILIEQLAEHKRQQEIGAQRVAAAAAATKEKQVSDANASIACLLTASASVGVASALVTFICVLYTTQISRQYATLHTTVIKY
jgi:hypothetical protein